MRWLLFESDTKSILSDQSDLVNNMYFRFQAESTSTASDIPICFIQGEGG